MTPKPLVAFYEANDFRFYGAGRVLLWLLQRLEHIQPLFIAPGEGVLTQRIRAAGIDAAIVPFPPVWRALDQRRGPVANLGKALLAPVFLAHTRALLRLFRQRGVQGVHANSTRAALYAGPAARLAGLPLWWHLRLERSPGAAERLAGQISDRVICVSSAVQRTLGGAGKSAVILDGIPTEHMVAGAAPSSFRQQLGWTPEHLVVGAVASLSPRKRHDLFIRMAQALVPAFPQARFVICGHLPAGAPAAHEQELRQLAAPLLNQNLLAMPGFVEDMAAAYAALDVLVFPSDAEGFGLVAVEAMMMGVPVVRTDVGGAEDMIADGVTGYLTLPGDLDDLITRVGGLLANEDLRRAMGRAGQVVARQRFDARRMAAEVETLLLARLQERRS